MASVRASYWPVNLQRIRKTFNKFITDIVYRTVCAYLYKNGRVILFSLVSTGEKRKLEKFPRVLRKRQAGC